MFSWERKKLSLGQAVAQVKNIRGENLQKVPEKCVKSGLEGSMQAIEIIRKKKLRTNINTPNNELLSLESERA